MASTFNELLESMNNSILTESTDTDPMETADLADEVKDAAEETDDLEELNDDELERLADELSDGLNPEDLDAIDDMDDDLEELTPSQDAEADDMMNIAATTQLLQNGLSEEDRRSLVESVNELKILVDEGFLLESDLDAILGNDETVTEKSWYATRQRIELGKEARLKQLYSVAVFAEARARNDADYRKLQKVYKMRNILRSRLEKKYQGPAKKRVREYVARLRSSKNKTLAKMGNEMSK